MKQLKGDLGNMRMITHRRESEHKRHTASSTQMLSGTENESDGGNPLSVHEALWRKTQNQSLAPIFRIHQTKEGTSDSQPITINQVKYKSNIRNNIQLDPIPPSENIKSVLKDIKDIRKKKTLSMSINALPHLPEPATHHHITNNKSLGSSSHIYIDTQNNPYYNRSQENLQEYVTQGGVSTLENIGNTGNIGNIGNIGSKSSRGELPQRIAAHSNNMHQRRSSQSAQSPLHKKQINNHELQGGRMLRGESYSEERDQVYGGVSGGANNCTSNSTNAINNVGNRSLRYGSSTRMDSPYDYLYSAIKYWTREGPGPTTERKSNLFANTNTNKSEGKTNILRPCIKSSFDGYLINITADSPYEINRAIESGRGNNTVESDSSWMYTPGRRIDSKFSSLDNNTQTQTQHRQSSINTRREDGGVGAQVGAHEGRAKSGDMGRVPILQLEAPEAAIQTEPSMYPTPPKIRHANNINNINNSNSNEMQINLLNFVDKINKEGLCKKARRIEEERVGMVTGQNKLMIGKKHKHSSNNNSNNTPQVKPGVSKIVLGSRKRKGKSNNTNNSEIYLSEFGEDSGYSSGVLGEDIPATHLQPIFKGGEAISIKNTPTRKKDKVANSNSNPNNMRKTPTVNPNTRKIGKDLVINHSKSVINTNIKQLLQSPGGIHNVETVDPNTCIHIADQVVDLGGSKSVADNLNVNDVNLTPILSMGGPPREVIATIIQSKRRPIFSALALNAPDL